MDEARAARLARLLSIALVLLGAVFVGFSILTDDTVNIILGAVIVVFGVVSLRFFGSAERFSDTRFGLTERHSFVVNVFQLVAVIVAFVLLASVAHQLESIAQVFDTGLPSVTLLDGVGILIGVVLGGGVVVLMQRFDAIGEMSSSRSARIIGFSCTFGTFVLLLVVQPAASTLYAIAYTVSRIGALVGGYTLPRV